jgi:hypothetical protein
MWQLAFAAISAGGQLLAGRESKFAAQMNAYNMKTESIQNQALAVQQANARREEYDLATAANLATFAAQGRDIGSDRSVAAFLERQKEIVGQDIGRIQTQSQMETLKMRSAALSERYAGETARRSSVFSAIGTIGQGIYDYQTTMAKGGTT